MAAQLRVLRRRIRSVESTKKITRAQELIAASRIVKAQQRVQASLPYAEEIVRALSAAASRGSTDHPLTSKDPNPQRAAIVVCTSDRGFAGAYSANVLRETTALINLLDEQGMQADLYVVGTKGVSYYTFRGRELKGRWTGFSGAPEYANAKEVAQAVIGAFLTPNEEGGVDEIHVVFTHFVNMVTQEVRTRRILPLEVVESDEEPTGGSFPLYEFEPSAEEVLDRLLPRYVESLVYAALLEAAASEHAARRRAMKSATDNAEELIKTLSRSANQARQAEITQELSEIVGGADALATTSAES